MTYITGNGRHNNTFVKEIDERQQYICKNGLDKSKRVNLGLLTDTGKHTNMYK